MTIIRNALEDERQALAGFERKERMDVTAVGRQRDGRVKGKREVVGLEYHPVLIDRRRVFGAAVVEARRAVELKVHVTTHALDGPHDAVTIFLNRTDGHKVDEFPDARAGQKACDQNIRVRQVQLL